MIPAVNENGKEEASDEIYVERAEQNSMQGDETKTCMYISALITLAPRKIGAKSIYDHDKNGWGRFEGLSDEQIARGDTAAQDQSCKDRSHHTKEHLGPEQ